MKQVKTFYSNYVNSLQENINKCIKDLQENGAEILDIKMEHHSGYFAYVIYNDKVPIDLRKKKVIG